MFAILYDETAEEDLRAFRVHEVRRILDEIDKQLTKEPTVPSRKRKHSKDWYHPGTAFVRCGSCGSERPGSSTMSKKRGGK